MTLPVPTFRVTAMPHPLKAGRDEFALGYGCSVEDAVVYACERAGAPLHLMHDGAAIVGDILVPKFEWATTYPRPGDQVIVKALPGGKFGSILTAIAVIGAQFIPGLQGWTLALARVAITVAGTLITQALTPAPRQNPTGERADAVSPSRSIQGVRNESRPYGVIPRVFGRVVNYYPPLAAAPYTEIYHDNEQYLRMVFCLGYGPLTISDMKIGDTPLAEYEDVTYEVREGYSTDTDLTLFPSQVREESLSIELKYTNGYSVRRTEPDTDQVSLDFLFPNGVQRITNRSVKFGISIKMQVQYRAVGSATWVDATFYSTAGGGAYYFPGGGIVDVQANSKAAIRRTVTVPLPSRGQYDIQVRRITVDDQSDNEGEDQSVTVEASYWAAFRSIRTGQPINATGMALVAIRARASDQLNGIIEQFNCTATAIIPVWNGATWTDTATRSPAWAYAEVLRGAANARPLADARIDLANLIDWAAQCATEGITFDGVIADRRSVFEMLQDICGTGNATPTINQGLYGVVIDRERTTVVQHFTPRNSANFSATKLFARRPHALRVRFPNELTLGQFDERFVYEDGYTAANATVFETLDLPYTTNATAAWKRARRAIFAARLRPEIYQLEVDAEHIVCTRGDMVRVTHDVPLWGIGAARVSALATSGANTTGVTIDAPMTMAAGTYQFRFRQQDGDTVVVPVNTVAGDQTVFTFTTPVATASGPAVGDLALFGEVDSESVELLVRSIEPRGDLRAVLTFVDHSPAIYDSDTGEIPDFDPQIQLPPTSNRAKPPVPTFHSLVSDEDIPLPRILVGFTLNQASGTIAAESIQVRYRPADTNGDYIWLWNLPAQSAQFAIAEVQVGETYQVQVRSVSYYGETSAWATIQHTVIGNVNAPDDVERLYRQGDAITWPYPDPPADLVGFLVRANYGTSQDWGMGRALHQGVVTAPPFDISALSGTQTLMVKAVDTAQNYSATAATLTIDLGDLVVANVIDTQSEAPGFSGTISGGTDTGSQLEASLLSSPPFWGNDDALFWRADGSDFWLANTYDELSYIATWTPASDQLEDGILKLDLTVVGDYTVDYRIFTSGTFWGAGGSAFWGADGDDFWDADTEGTFTPWPGELGPFDTIADSYQVRVTVAGGAVQGIVSQMDLIVDVPDITELFDSIAIAVTTGTRLTLTKTYRAIDNINVTREDDGGTGANAAYYDKQANPGAAGGPLIKVSNLAGAIVAGTVDVRIKGH